MGAWSAGCGALRCSSRPPRVDDPCDGSGVHGVCGIVGCIMTGIFAASSLGGAVGFAEGVTMGHQLLVQLGKASPLRLSGLVWWQFIGYKLRISTVGLRVPE
ncbi:hypothetical protein ACNKHM_04820 [Shigella sonnei]